MRGGRRSRRATAGGSATLPVWVVLGNWVSKWSRKALRKHKLYLILQTSIAWPFEQACRLRPR